MPLVRYEIRNEYSLANPELYRSAAKDEPETLLEGVAMAGLVGIVRQLGDLADFAAEIFHDLHEVVMATAARSHELMIRVQQLEVEIPSIEKALMSETNQLRFAYTIGADWHASIRNDQNHLTQGDLPRFIRNSYEECRGPPRLFLLDRFDVAGTGACLKRYTDPSFFKMAWANSQLWKAEKTQRERSIVRVKKKIRRRRNGDTAEVAGTFQHNSRVHYSSLDLNGLMGAPRNLLNISNRRLKSKWVNGSQQSQVIGKNSIQGSSNPSASKKNLHDRVLSQQWNRKPMAGMMVHKAQMMDNLASDAAPKLQSLKLSAKDIEAGIMALNIMHGERKVVFNDGESKPEGPADVGRMDDAGSETDNFVDALTTMDSEIETDYEYQIKHEVDSDFNSDHRRRRLETTEDLQAEDAECCVFADVEASENFNNVELPDDSAKVGTCVRLYNTESADGVADLKSAPCSVNTPSEDSFEIVEPAGSFPSIHASADCRHNEPLADLDKDNISVTVANIQSSNSVNTVQECNTANEEALSDHVNAPSFATAADCVSAASDNYVQTPDAVLNRSLSFAFTSFEPSAVHGCAESRNNESIGDLDSGNISATGRNIVLSRSEDTFQKQDATFATAADFVPGASNSEVKTSDAVLNRSSSFAFINFVPSEVSLNATSACFDNAEAFFRFTTPESSIMHNNVISSSAAPNEELFVITKSSAGVIDVKMKICSPNIEIPCNSSLPVISTDFNTIESVAASNSSEFTSGLHDAVMQEKHASTDELDSRVPFLFADSSQGGLSSASSEFASGCLDVMMPDEHQCIDLQVDCAENEIPAECVSNEKTYSRLEPSTGFSSMTSVGCICALSEGEIINGGSPAECMHARPSTLLCADTSSSCASSDMLGSGMHAESVGNQANAALPIEGVPQTKSVIMKVEPADPAYTISRLPVMPIESPPALVNAEMLENVPLPAKSCSRESSGDMLGDKLTAILENSKFDVDPLREDLNDSIAAEGIPVELAQAESAYVGPAESLTGSTSSTIFCKELPPNEFIEADVEGFLSAKDPDVCLNTMPTVAAFHSSSSAASTDAGLHEFVNIEPHADLSAEEHAMAPIKSLDVEVPTNSICNELGTEYVSVEPPMNFVVEPCSAFANVGSSPSISHMDVCAHELPSLPPEHVLSSNPATQLLHSPYSGNSEYVPETLTPERNSLEFSTECTPEPTVFSGIAMHTDGSFDSPRIAIASGTSLANTSSPSTPREAIMPNVEYVDVKPGSGSTHSSNISIVSSPRSPISNALDSSLSSLMTSGDTQAFAKCQSIDLVFENLAPSSPTTEPSFQVSNSSETPQPPPLPPLEWQITRPHQSSCSQHMKLIEFPAPPLPPLKPDSLVKNTFSPPLPPGMEKICIERNDSLIKAIASHDKSTLRKVIRQTQSVKPKPLDEREELLEQIRNRAFSLRRTVVKKHEIPRAPTNINVSVILEKAAAIRQAFVGSEDEEDSDWSDA